MFGLNWDKSFKKPLCYSQSPLLTDPPPPPHEQSCLKLVCNVNIVYGNLKSENCQVRPETSTKLYVHEFVSGDSNEGDGCEDNNGS